MALSFITAGQLKALGSPNPKVQGLGLWVLNCGEVFRFRSLGFGWGEGWRGP